MSLDRMIARVTESNSSEFDGKKVAAVLCAARMVLTQEREYVVTDRLNPNAINARYGRPVSECDVDRVQVRFTAPNDEYAFMVFDRLVETGKVGYNADLGRYERVNAKLWRAEDFYKKHGPVATD